MKVLGLVTEYNPFHNGHQFHLNASKKISGADYVICIMSGNYIQRGEPALLNKWARTEMALKNGVDLVIELPVSYVLQSAEYFAFGAVKILNNLNIVDYICFGSECGQIEPLKIIAQILINEPKAVSVKIKELLNNGKSFPKAREIAIAHYLKNQHASIDAKEIMSSPNNILGIEYIKALYRLKSRIVPLTIKRHKTGYHSTETKDEIASATAIRSMLKDNTELETVKPFVPLTSFDILYREKKEGHAPVFKEYFDTSILTLLRRLNALELSSYPDVTEGLENRIKKAVHSFGTLDDVIASVNTKRYTQTRLQRIMYNVLLGITKDMIFTFGKYGGPQYARVLGMNDNGKELLKIARKKASLPIVVKPSAYQKSCNPLFKKMIELDFLATDLYTLHYPSVDKRKGKLDFVTSPVIM